MIFVPLHAVIVSAALALADVTSTADGISSSTDMPDMLDSLAIIPQITFSDTVPTGLSLNATDTNFPIIPEPTFEPSLEPTPEPTCLEPTGNLSLGNATFATYPTTSTRVTLNTTATGSKPSANGPTSSKESTSIVPPSNGSVKLSAMNIGLPLVAVIACLL